MNIRNAIVSFLFLSVLSFTHTAGATGVAVVPRTSIAGIEISSPGNFQFRLNLNPTVAAGSDNCAFMYFEGTDSAAAQKYQSFLAAYLAGKQMVFTVDTSVSGAYCHVSEISF